MGLLSRFHKSKEYKQLKRMVEKSKDISEKHKEDVLKNLVSEDVSDLFLGDSSKYKHLFATAMFYRAYDIYTSSLLAFMFRNRVAVITLMRAQFENMCIVSYYLENKDEIKNAFLEEGKVDLWKARECLAKRCGPEFGKEMVNSMYHDLSQKVHPFPEGFKSYFGGTHLLSWGEASPLPEFKPTLHVAPHHEELDDKDTVIGVINGFFVGVVNGLFELIHLDVDDKISDYSEVHRK